MRFAGFVDHCSNNLGALVRRQIHDLLWKFPVEKSGFLSGPSCTMFLMAALLVEGGKFIILLSTCLSSRAPLVALDEFVGFKGSVIL